MTSVALSSSTPFQGGLPINAFTLENDTLPPGAPQPGAFRVIVTPGYARNAGAEAGGRPLLRGSGSWLRAGACSSSIRASRGSSFPTARPSADGSPSAVGRTNLKTGPTIIGVVKDVPHNGVEEKSGNPFIYQVMQGGRPGGLTLFLRTDRPAGDVVSALRDKVRAIDPASSAVRRRRPGGGGGFVLRQPPRGDAAARGVCRSGAVPVGARHLRRAGLRRVAADARDRRAQRHRCVARADRRPDPAAGAVERRASASCSV